MTTVGGDRIWLSPPDVDASDRAALLAAFDGGWIAPVGPDVDGFEADMVAHLGDGMHAAALASGTAGLHLALRLLGVGPGEEVLVATLTFAATANAVAYVGATPVFVDADAATWQIDPDRVAEAIEERISSGRPPAAVIAVDLYGQCADYDRLAGVCEPHHIPVIEDAAEALGATYRGRPAGTLGRVAVLSFNGNKIISTSGGGMLVSADAALVARARFLATQAREPAAHYEHAEIGHNYRLSNLLAALGRSQLSRLDAKVAARRAIRVRYEAGLADLPGVEFLREAGYGTPTHWLTVLTVDPDAAGVDRERLRLALDAAGIEARPVWKPMHLQPVFADAPTVGGAVAADLFTRGLCLPSGSTLTAPQQDRIIEVFRAACGAA